MYAAGGVVTPSKKTPTRLHQSPAPRQKPPQFPQYGQSMLNNARQEIEQLDSIVDQLKFQIQVFNRDKHLPKAEFCGAAQLQYYED